MPQIFVDDNTLLRLEAVAKARGLTVSEYLQNLSAQQGDGNLPPFSVADSERELDQLATDGPTLPPDFSRAEIYAEHD